MKGDATNNAPNYDASKNEIISPYKAASLYGSIQTENYNGRSINERSIASHDETTSFILSPEEKENLKYNMKTDKVVVFYKKILGEIRDVIKEERSNIKKYLP